MCTWAMCFDHISPLSSLPHLPASTNPLFPMESPSAFVVVLSLFCGPLPFIKPFCVSLAGVQI